MILKIIILIIISEINESFLCAKAGILPSRDGKLLRAHMRFVFFERLLITIAHGRTSPATGFVVTSDVSCPPFVSATSPFYDISIPHDVAKIIASWPEHQPFPGRPSFVREIARLLAQLTQTLSSTVITITGAAALSTGSEAIAFYAMYEFHGLGPRREFEISKSNHASEVSANVSSFLYRLMRGSVALTGYIILINKCWVWFICTFVLAVIRTEFKYNTIFFMS